MNFILYSLFLFFFVSAHSRPKRCGHDYLKSHNINQDPNRLLFTTNYYSGATIQAEKNRLAQGLPPQWSNVRITYDFQFFNQSTVTNTTKYNFFVNNLMNAVRHFYQSSIKIFPNNRTIYPPSTLCGNPKFVINSNHGYNNTDMILFVTSENNKSADYIAWASVCQRDSLYFGRPNVGQINVNFYYLDWELTGFDPSFKTLTHELFHFMVFSAEHYSYYIYENGTNIGLNNVVLADTTVTGRYKLILPLPTSFGQKFFNCPTLDGLWLEDNEGVTGPGSHWEDSFFRDVYDKLR